jgi:hypothetical protein
MDKKSQVGEVLVNWIVAMIVVFGLIIFSMLWFKPWQKIDSAISPKIDSSYQAGGNYATDIPVQQRRNQAVIPIILIGGTILIAVFASIKRDPNHPYQ